MKRFYKKPLSGLILASLLMTAGCSDSSEALRQASSEKAMSHRLGTSRHALRNVQRTPSEIIPPMPSSPTAQAGPVADTYAEIEKTGYQIAKEDSKSTLPEEELEITAAEVTEEWNSGPATLEDYDLLDARVQSMTYGEVRSRFDDMRNTVERTEGLATHQQEIESIETLMGRVSRLGNRIPESKEDTQIAYPDLVRKLLEVQLEVDEFYEELRV